jgi:hypothetical protein
VTACGVATARGVVRKTPSWPRTWANFSLLQLYPYMYWNAWADLHLLGQANLTPFLFVALSVEPDMTACGNATVLLGVLH